jgi:hypothetical protein
LVLAPGEVGASWPDRPDVEMQETAVQQHQCQLLGVRISLKQRYSLIEELEGLADAPGSHEQHASLSEQDSPVLRRGHVPGSVEEAQAVFGAALFGLYVRQAYQEPGDKRLVDITNLLLVCVILVFCPTQQRKPGAQMAGACCGMPGSGRSSAALVRLTRAACCAVGRAPGLR